VSTSTSATSGGRTRRPASTRQNVTGFVVAPALGLTWLAIAADKP